MPPETSELLPYDFKCIAELRSAMKFGPVAKSHRTSSLQSVKLDQTLQTDSIASMAAIVCAIEENFVCRTIRGLKRIEAFRSLKTLDQFALFKKFYHKFKALYSAFIYNVEQDGFMVSEWFFLLINYKLRKILLLYRTILIS